MLNPFSAKSFSTPITRHKRSGNMDSNDVIAVLAILVLGGLLLGAATGVFSISRTGGTGSSGNVTSCSSVNPQNTAQQLKISDSAQQGASALTSPSANYFTSSGQGFSTDNPGSLSSPVTSSGSYSLQSGYYAEVTATGAYPVWAALNGNAAQMGPFQVLAQATSTPGATAGTCVTALQFTQIAAPASGTSATTNVKGVVTSSDGTALGTISNTINTSPVEWYNSLNILSTYTGAGYGVNVMSTQSNSVVDYATGATLPAGQFQNFVPIEMIFVNSTNVYINLDQSAPAGLTMTRVTNPALTSGTTAYVISGFQGCAPTGGSVTSYACLNAPIDVYRVGGSGHVGITFIWADMQQAAYAVSNAKDPAVTSWPAAGAAAGLPTGFTFLIPTSGPDSGAPTVLIEQSFTVIQAL